MYVCMYVCTYMNYSVVYLTVRRLLLVKNDEDVKGEKTDDCKKGTN